MSDTEVTNAGNGEKKTLPNGLKHLAPVGLNKRERIALGILQSLLRAESVKTRRNKAKDLANEAFDIADIFLAEADEERTEQS